MVTQYVGHGIGRVMHENPQVPNFVSTRSAKARFPLDEGLVLAVEPMVNMGRADTDTLRDHWTVVTRDGLPSVHVEHTLADDARRACYVDRRRTRRRSSRARRASRESARLPAGVRRRNRGLRRADRGIMPPLPGWTAML